MTPELLTLPEVRRFLRLGRNALYGMIRRREIVVVKIGTRFLVPKPEVDRIIAQNTIPARRSFFKSHHQPGLSSPAGSQDRA